MACAGSGLGRAARVLALGGSATAALAAVLTMPTRSSASPSRPSASADAVGATDKAAALAATREGNRLLDAGKPHEALEKFQKAHQLVGGDKLRFNLGQALRAIPGREVEAFTEFDTFLARVPSAPPDLIEEAATERRLLGARLGFITVDAPEQAIVSVDGEDIGKAPLAQAIVVRPGPHAIHVDKLGFRPADDNVTVGAGERLSRTFTLTRIDVNVVVAGAGQDHAAAGAEEPARGGPGLSRDGDKPSTLLGRWWFWAAAGAVVAAAITIAVLAGQGGKTTFQCPSGPPSCQVLP